jgi:hypothetical protein
LEKYLEKINWQILSHNPNAISILKNNVDKIHWYELSENPNLNAIHLLENNLEKINWTYIQKSKRNFFITPFHI